jgi:hypothetical protein
MSDELYGVFFRDQGVSEYLVAIACEEEAAIEDASERDQRAFEEDMEKHADESDEYPEPAWEDYDGMFYVEPISHELADASSYELERGLTVRVVDN